MKKLLTLFCLTLLIGCVRVGDIPLDAEDAALFALLDELDDCQRSGDREQCFRLYSQISAVYESKNLTSLQKHYQQKMLDEAMAIRGVDEVRGLALMAEACQQLATSYMVEGQLDSAALLARRAFLLAPQDTLDFRAQSLLLLAQIHLQSEQVDSLTLCVSEAEEICPKAIHTDLYRILHAYTLDRQGRDEELMALLPSYIEESGLYGQAELTRLLMFLHDTAGQWQEAYDDALGLMAITDSIARAETSTHTARIHSLQHERQMALQRAEREAERARLYVVIIVVLVLLLVALAIGLFYRRKAQIAHASELEAMRLSELAQGNENKMREENIRLQRLYYEHLFAIILPILNAHRGKNGHINLEESSWELIEKNTDMVLPCFTSRLRQQHPSLTTEDVRFCCLLMMRVPNVLLADIYGISASSVAVRKQRMKKKLDSDVQNQTIENYLNQYVK